MKKALQVVCVLLGLLIVLTGMPVFASTETAESEVPTEETAAVEAAVSGNAQTGSEDASDTVSTAEVSEEETTSSTSSVSGEAPAMVAAKDQTAEAETGTQDKAVESSEGAKALSEAANESTSDLTASAVDADEAPAAPVEPSTDTVVTDKNKESSVVSGEEKKTEAEGAESSLSEGSEDAAPMTPAPMALQSMGTSVLRSGSEGDSKEEEEKPDDQFQVDIEGEETQSFKTFAQAIRAINKHASKNSVITLLKETIEVITGENPMTHNAFVPIIKLGKHARLTIQSPENANGKNYTLKGKTVDAARNHQMNYLVHIESGTLSLRNIVIDLCESMANIRVSDGATAELDNVEISNYKGTTSALEVLEKKEGAPGEISINNSKFENNKSIELKDQSGNTKYSNYAGAVGISDNYNVTIDNSTFKNNEGSLGGAIRYESQDPAKIVITNSTFEGNKAIHSALSGGAVAILSNGNSDEVDAHIENSTFKNNISSSYGGAVYIGQINQNKNKAAIINSVFENNTSYYGGAVYSYKGDITIKNSDFNENKSSCGGAVYMYESPVSIENSLFDKNEAQYGGGIYLDLSPLTLSGGDKAVFKGNKAAYQGGAVCIWEENQADNNTNEVLISNVKFNGNLAGKSGGAIYASGNKTTLNNVDLNGNYAKDFGGAVFYNKGINQITGTRFVRNSTHNHGGAIYIIKNKDIPVSLKVDNNTDFKGNIAGRDGGAIYIFPGSKETVYKAEGYAHVTLDATTNFQNNKAVKLYFPPELAETSENLRFGSTSLDNLVLPEGKKAHVLNNYDVNARGTEAVIVLYNGNNADGNAASLAKAFEINSEQTIMDPADQSLGYSREGYQFKGWNTAADGSGTAYAVGDAFNADAPMALYAQWEENMPEPDYMIPEPLINDPLPDLILLPEDFLPEPEQCDAQPERKYIPVDMTIGELQYTPILGTKPAEAVVSTKAAGTAEVTKAQTQAAQNAANLPATSAVGGVLQNPLQAESCPQHVSISSLVLLSLGWALALLLKKKA